MDRFDVMAAIGLVCTAIGLGLIYAPLGLIVFGVGLIGGAILGARGNDMAQMDARQEHSGITKEA